MTEERRAKLTTYVLVITSVLTFAISWRFLAPYRTFPTVPYVSGLHSTEFSVAVLLIGCVGLVLASIPRHAIVGLSIFLVCISFLILEDQSRLQPYIYVFLIVAVGLLYHAVTGGKLNTLRTAIIFVYLWAGIQKLNVHYFRDVFPWVFFTPRITHWLSFLTVHPRIVEVMALSSALLEVGAAALLFSRRGRQLGVLGVAAIHTIALILIGPIGIGYAPVVWPWNFAMVAFVWILFWNYDGSLFPVRDPTQVLAVVLFGLLPILNLFSLWDDYLSFHAFSGATMNAYLQIRPGKQAELPLAAQRVLEGNKVAFVDWSLLDTRASAYPAERVYRYIFWEICKTAPDVQLVIVSKPKWPSGRTKNLVEDCPQKH